jgi:regulator of protease activity HflC (stomatin/prohibitin superfamily)
MNNTGSVVAITIGVIVLILGFAFGLPIYRVWQQEMSGRAEFAKAEQNRRIMIEEAKANLEAEKLNAEAEIIRAEGAAKAIAVENGSLTPTYIQYLWVRTQQMSGAEKIIYVPTEASLPILEAQRK